MSRTTEVLSTVAAGAAGATVAVTVVGASLALVVPAIVGVAAISLVAATNRPSDHGKRGR